MQDIFGDIYKANAWGGTPTQFSSGSGSDEGVNDAYVNLVLSLMKSEQISRMVDLGCGDFGSDVELPGRERLILVATSFATSFSATVRISSDQVSSFARLILLRTASLMEIFVSSGKFSSTCRTMISQLCSKNCAYRLVLITDEQVLGNSAPANCDILPYHGTRRLFGQGLQLEREPFKEKIDVLLEHSSGVDYGPTTRDVPAHRPD